MPVLKTRYDHTKVFRPNGSRYAEGEFEIILKQGPKQRLTYATTHALHKALEAFENEFGELPFWVRDPKLAPFVGDIGVIETVVSGEMVRVTVWEIPDDEEGDRHSSLALRGGQDGLPGQARTDAG